MVQKIVNSVAVVLASTFAFTGCTDSSKEEGTVNTKGNTFYYNLSAEPKTLNPVTGTDLYVRYIEEYVGDTLLKRNPDTYEWDLSMAESYEVSKDGQTFKFKLKPNLKFHDGKPVTTEDIKASLEAPMSQEYGAFFKIPYYESIGEIKIIDPLQIEIKAKEKYFGTLDTLATTTIIPKHIYGNAAEGKKINKTTTLSGPYRVAKYDTGNQIILEKNKDWWGWGSEQNKGRYNFDRIVMKFITEQNVVLQMLKKGELDYSPIRAEDFVKNMEGEDFKSVVKVQAENKAPKGTGFIGWNFKSEILKSKNVRVALAHLANRNEMNKKFYYDKSLLATGPWYQQNDSADPSVKPIEFNPSKAAELLKAEGWADTDKDGTLDKVIDGKKRNFEITLLNPSKDVEKVFVLYQEDLKKAGIKMNIQFLEWNSFSKKRDEMDFDAIAMAWGGVIDGDPKQIWHSSNAIKGGSNYISYKNPEVDKLIDEGRVELDNAKRRSIFRKVYRLIADDAPYMFMFNPKYVFYATSPRIQRPKDTRVYDLGMDEWSIKN